MSRSAYLGTFDWCLGIPRAEVMADAMFNAKHEAAGGASTSVASGALKEPMSLCYSKNSWPDRDPLQAHQAPLIASIEAGQGTNQRSGSG
eukprot:1162009-Pelagomonas_calceolata.AAC.12